MENQPVSFVRNRGLANKVVNKRQLLTHALLAHGIEAVEQMAAIEDREWQRIPVTGRQGDWLRNGLSPLRKF